MQNDIKNNEISVVVQGAIAGSKDNAPKHRLTEICLNSVRKILPGATIILSTWEGSNTEDLDYDVLVLNKDPGSNIMGEHRTNCFRQIVSSVNGLKACKTKYAVKLRTDFELTGSKFLDYFIEYNKLSFNPEYKILNQRVVTITTCNANRRTKWPFNICDWFFFGLTEDVTNIFDIPLEEKKVTLKNKSGQEYEAVNPYTAEQYIWFQFLSKYKPLHFEHQDDLSHDNVVLTEKYFANNCIFLSSRRAGINWLKFPGTAYAQVPAFSNCGLYTFNEYKRLLNKYAGNHITIVPNIFEDAAYLVVYNLRLFVKTFFPKFHVVYRHAIEMNHHNRVQKMRAKTGAK